VRTSGTPTVVNIWASWCIPCRSEAPLLDTAHDAFGDEVTFIGIAVGDAQIDARSFLAEFGIMFDNYFDRPRNVPAALGRTGVPLTFFFGADGSLVHSHSGVIDERTLAINIDDLLAR
jgi:cytochrome c biogenesis protein CcmG/thiol:disulfide interchange protein DsbE